jgi:hypothetical protein
VISIKDAKGPRFWHAGKPIRKPDYNSGKMMSDLQDTVVQLYVGRTQSGELSANGAHPSLRRIAEELAAQYSANGEINYGISPIKIRKILITAGVYECDNENYKLVTSLHRKGFTSKQIRNMTGLPMATVNSYLPYARTAYRMDETGGERSVAAEREDRYRKRIAEKRNN